MISLPDGWLPEGIAIGPGPTFYAGSRANGAVYRGDVRTGQGEVFIQGQDGRVAVGLEYDARCGLLFVAGGATGQGYVYDAETGESVASFQFTAPPTFVNDVTVTTEGAYFTDSQQAVLYRVGLTDCTTPGPVSTIALAGDWTQVVGSTNANGIVADPSGKRLLVVNSTTGGLFSVDPTTGAAELIVAPPVPAGDGLLLRGRTLYVVQNRLNQIAVVELDPGWESGQLVDILDRRRPRHPDHRRPLRERALRRERTIHHAADTDHPVPGRSRRAPLSRPLQRLPDVAVVSCAAGRLSGRCDLQ